ncbi:MAG: rod shape-determining protein MreD [Candidatus Omnitrophica bacterium]|nr:rod shape-determining protein MreD [Candidatus Omnitrophota bacterium]
MKKLIFFFLIIIFALLQATLLNCIDIFNIKPDLLLASVIISSLSFNPVWALSLSIFAGILKDIFSANTFGMNTILFFLWSLFIIELSRGITFDSKYIRLALIFIIAILNNIIIRLIFLFLGNLIPWGIFLRITLVESLYTALFLPLVFKFSHSLLNVE